MKTNRLLITLLLTIIAVQVAFSGDKIRVMGQNVENFFYLTTETSDQQDLANLNYTTESRTAKMNAILQAYFRDNIPVADIYCFNEIECSDDILNYIATNFSQKTGLNFTYVQDGLSTYDGNGNIIRKSGFVYNKDVVKPYGPSMATGYGQVYTRFMRMQTFEEIASGKRFTVSMNHFKAGSVGVIDSYESNYRTENATALLQALPNALDPDILVMGDMNSFYGQDDVKKVFIDAINGSGKGTVTDVWVELQNKGLFPETKDDGISGGEVLDKILYVNPASGTQIKAVSMKLDIDGYLQDGKPLGDHYPLAATFQVLRRDSPVTNVNGLMDAEQDDAEYYNLGGQRIGQPTKGLVIERQRQDNKKRIIK